ncbi:MAG: c-type cytochrome [Ideonella sp.]
MLLAAATALHAQSAPYEGIGRPATAKELAAWDIDVRPDFKGLPKGSGSVAKGMDVWESRCSSCHGIFGESNQYFAPLVGGTTKEDIATGHVARLNDRSFPSRTTLMKVSTVSTLWDYVNRAMPWNAPKSLSVEEVYAVVAYLLNMGGIVADDFTLSDGNIAQVQQRMPNRNGMTTAHALWPGAAFGNQKPDVLATACMKNCGPEPMVASTLPDFARNSHGNLADQNRAVGAQHGADTLVAESMAPVGSAEQRARLAAATNTAAPTPPALPAGNDAGISGAVALTTKNGCVACHGIENKIIGPSFRDVADKYAKRTDAVAYLAGKMKAGSSGVWGAIQMPAQALSDAEARTIAQWLANGAKK